MSQTTPWVLVVDDTRDSSDILRRVLLMLGYDAKCASNGEDAMRMVRESQCGLMLLDLMMPGMTGFDVLRALRDDPAVRDVPVVIYSASDRHTHWQEVRELGARDYIMKAEEALMTRLQAVLTEHVGAVA